MPQWNHNSYSLEGCGGVTRLTASVSQTYCIPQGLLASLHCTPQAPCVPRFHPPQFQVLPAMLLSTPLLYQGPPLCLPSPWLFACLDSPHSFNVPTFSFSPIIIIHLGVKSFSVFKSTGRMSRGIVILKDINGYHQLLFNLQTIKRCLKLRLC